MKVMYDESGMTLIEVLVYVALFGLIFVTILQYAATMVQFNATARQRTVADKHVLFLEEHIRDTVRKATGIEESESVFNQGVSSIQFSSDEGILWYHVTNGILNFYDGVDAESITDPDCQITRFYLEPIRNAGDELIGFRAEISVMTRSDRPETRKLSSTYLLGVL